MSGNCLFPSFFFTFYVFLNFYNELFCLIKEKPFIIYLFLAALGLHCFAWAFSSWQ